MFKTNQVNNEDIVSAKNLVDIIVDAKENEDKYFPLDEEIECYEYDSRYTPFDKIFNLTVPEFSFMAANMDGDVLHVSSILDSNVRETFVKWLIDNKFLTPTVNDEIDAITRGRRCKCIDRNSYLFPKSFFEYNTIGIHVAPYAILELPTLIFSAYVLGQKVKEYADIVFSEYMNHLVYYDYYYEEDENEELIPTGPHLCEWLDNIKEDPRKTIEAAVTGGVERQAKFLKDIQEELAKQNINVSSEVISFDL